MKLSRWILRAFKPSSRPLIAAALMCSVGTAAEPGTSRTASPLSANDEVITLSPFEVTADNARGYYSANTMSGTRLNTKLEDLGSSITVVTKEQMQDFAMLNLNDVFSYEANTEGTGNFTDMVIDRRGNTVDNISDNPQGANRIRGIGAANIAIGNFATSGRVPMDPSLLDSVEISRGPNSNIFGLGSAAGTVNLVPASANLLRNNAQVQMRADSYDGYRGGLDLNRVLKPGVLAIRGSMVQQHEGFVRKPSGTDTRRYNGFVKYQPFKNTTLRATINDYHMDGTRANAVTPRDAISYWKSSGSPTWDPVTFTAKRDGASIGTYKVNTTLPDFFQQTTYINRPSLFIDQNGLGLWTVNQTGSTASPNAPNQSIRFLESAPAPVRTNQPLFSTVPAVSDKSLYDWEHINLGAVNYVDDRDRTSIVELEQIILRSERQLLAAQLGWFREDAKRYNRNLVGSAAAAGVASFLEIDVNETLLDGSPNPYFLRPYLGIAEPTSVRDQFKNDTYRAQLAYMLDFRRDDGWKSWLGQHQVAGYYENKESTYRVYRYRDVMADNHSTWLPAGNPRGNQAAPAGANVAHGYFRYYVGDKNGGNVDYAPTGFDYGNYNFHWYNGATKQWLSEPAVLSQVASTDNSGGTFNQRNVLKTAGAVIQSHLIKDRVVTTFGIRQDKNYTMFGGTPGLAADGLDFDYAKMNSWTGVWNQRSGRTKTAGVVVKPLRWLSVYLNKSDSFQPATPSQNILRQELPSPTGEGKDYGFALNLFDGKLVIRVNQYETKQKNSPYGQSGTFAQRILSADFVEFNNGSGPKLNSAARTWIIADAQKRGVTMSEEQIQDAVYKTLQLTPQDFQEFQRLPVTDVADISGKGKEIEINYNPTAFWTLKLNVTQQKAIDSNLAPALLEWANKRLPVWQNVVDLSTGKLWWTENFSTAQTVEQFYQVSVLTPIKLSQATEGQARPQVREYRANLSTNLQLSGITDHKILKRFNIGGALRWEDQGAIGFYGQQQLPASITDLDPNRPIWDGSHLYVDAFIGYRTRLFNKIGAKFQLNVRNLTEPGGRLQPIAAFPDGTPNSYRIIDPRQFILSATFDL